MKHSGFQDDISPRVDAKTPPLPSSVPPARLVRETALEQVRGAIASGALRPGSRVTERSLCETFGVSRTLAREIVRQLEAERLIDVIPHRGLRIAVLAPQDVREIYTIRAELEVIVVRAFIATATEADLDLLREKHAALNAAALHRDIPMIVNLVTAFLRFVIDVSGSKVAGELLDHLLGRINMLRVYAMNAPGQLDISVAQMNMIVESILARDAAAAEPAVRTYVETAGRSALTQLSALRPLG